jgi:hypothetical protein
MYQIGSGDESVHSTDDALTPDRVQYNARLKHDMAKPVCETISNLWSSNRPVWDAALVSKTAEEHDEGAFSGKAAGTSHA